MRRIGGFVLAFALAVAACATTDQSVASRSTLPAPVVFGSDTTTSSSSTSSSTSTSTSTTTTTETATVNDSTADGADDPTLDVPDQPASTSNPELNPVLLGARTPPSSPDPGPSGPQPTGRIDIPAIGLSHDTYEGVDLSTLNHGPGHWPRTAMPGHAGNTVFPGHRTTHSRPFWDIDHLRAGDDVTFTTDEGRFTYQVTDTFIVDDEETWIVEQTGTATFTIFACHPKGSARQRYVVKGDLVSSPATTTTTKPARPPSTTTTQPEDDDSLLDILFG